MGSRCSPDVEVDTSSSLQHHKWRRRWDSSRNVSRSCSVLYYGGATAGCLEPFNPDVESIVVYLEQMELYFEAYKYTRSRQTSGLRYF